MRLPKTLPPRIPIILAAISLSASKGDQTATTQILSETSSNAEGDFFENQNKKDILLITFSLHSSKLDVYSNTCMSFLTRARTRDRFHEAWAHTMTIGSRLVSSQNKRPFEILP